MGNTEENQISGVQVPNSEVARILQQIREEYESAQQGLSGVAYGNSQHAFITAKMENMGVLHEELQKLVGQSTAITLVASQLEDCSSVSV
jgi:hypothetical protein